MVTGGGRVADEPDWSLKRPVLWILFLLVACFPTWLHAEPRVSFPLEGFYRPGKFLAMRVENARAGDRVAIAGCVPIEVRSDGLVPAVVVEESTDSQLKRLEDRQRLVVYTGPDARGTKSLFPEFSTIAIHVDGTTIPAAAVWDSVDGIVLDRVSNDGLARWKSICESTGATLAILANDSPGEGFERIDAGLWVWRSAMIGPNRIFDAAAELPTLGWHPGQSEVVRRGIVLAGVIFSILVLAISLLPKGSVTGIAVMSAATFAGIWIVAERNPGHPTERASVIVQRGLTQQRDQWAFHTTLRETEINCRLDDGERPVFSSAADAKKLRARIVQNEDGSCDMRLTLPAQRSLAVLETRQVEPAKAYSTIQPVRSRLLELVHAGYLKKGTRITGEITDAAREWRSVVVNSEKE